MYFRINTENSFDSKDAREGIIPLPEKVQVTKYKAAVTNKEQQRKFSQYSN